MGRNDLYLHIGRKSGKTITDEAIKREYERVVQEHEKRERLYAFLAAHGKPLDDADGLLLCAERQEKNLRHQEGDKCET